MKAILGILISFTYLYGSRAFAQAAATTVATGPLAASFINPIEQEQQPPIRVSPPVLTTPSVRATHETKLQTLAASCTSKGSLARGVCLTSLNPKIATAASGITALLAAMDATAGQKDSCEKFGSAMDIAKAAVTAYTGACGAARMYCTSTCGQLTKYITQYVQPDLAKAATSTTESIAAGVDQKTIATYLAMPSELPKQLEQCDKYKLKIASATVGLINIVQSAKGGKNCEDQLAAGAGDGSLDCSKPENAQVIDCMCRTNPTLAGCAGGGAGSNDPYQNLAGDYSESSSSSDSNVDLSATPAVDTTSAFASESASGGAAGFNGGGGGQGGIAGNGSGKAADGGKGTGKGLNKNILSGYEGGSGGGAGGSAGYSDDGYANQFKAFMPGGDKDPSRNPANAVFAGGQVTGAGSKSNWEKVSERYQANRPSFIQGGP